MTASLLPNGKQQFLDSNGQPLAAGSVYFYIPSTTTFKDTWQDATQTILNTNPVVLDAAGEAVIFGTGSYRQVVKDVLGNTIWDEITYGQAIDSTTTLTFNTRADAAASTLVNGMYFETLGYAAAGDGGGAKFVAQASNPGGTLAIALASGNYAKCINYALKAEMFGLFPGETAAETYWTSIVSELNNRNGCSLDFAPGATYSFYSTNPGSTFEVLAGFSGISNTTTFNFNGAKFDCPLNFGSLTLEVRALSFDNCANIILNDPYFTQSNYTTLDDTYGTIMIYPTNGSRSFKINRPRQNGGRAGFLCERSGSYSATNQCKGFEIWQANMQNVYYPINCAGDGFDVDYYEARHVSCGRDYFPWNVARHNVQIWAQNGGPFDAVLIKVYAYSGDAIILNTIEDINVDYYTDQRVAVSNSNSSICRLAFQQADATSTPAYMRNISVKVTGYSGVTYPLPVGFTTEKYTSSAVADTTVRGYVMENIKLSGYLTGYNGGTLGVDLFPISYGTFDGEMVRGISLEDFTLEGSSTGITIRGSAIYNQASLKNVISSGPISIGAPSIGVINLYEEVSSTTIKSRNYVGFADGQTNYERLPNGRIIFSGVKTVNAGASVTVSLPAGLHNVDGAGVQNYSSSGSTQPWILTYSEGSAPSLTITKDASGGNTLVSFWISGYSWD